MALQHDRQHGAMGGTYPISYTALSAYAQDHGIHGSLFEALKRIVKAMDDVYVEIQNDKVTKSVEKPPDDD